MFAKLLKHEIRATYKMRGLLLLVIAFLATLYTIMKALQIPIITEMMYAFLFVLVGAQLVIMQIFIIIRYYSSMYGKVGYLSHTLPVPAGQLFWSKVLVDFVWSILSVIAFILGSRFLLPEAFLDGLGSVVREICSAISVTPGSLVFYFWVALLVVMLILSNLSTIYFCISLGSSATFHALSYGGPVVIYLLSYMAQQLIASISLFIPVALVLEDGRLKVAIRNTADLLIGGTSEVIPNYVPFMSVAVWPVIAVATLIWAQYLVKNKTSLR